MNKKSGRLKSMEIYVNDQSLDFELSQNIPLSSVLDHIQNWANQQDFYILDYKYTTTANAPVSGEYLLSSEISRLDIAIGNHSELLGENIEELRQILNRYGQNLAFELNGNNATIDFEKYREGLSWIITSAEAMLKHISEDAAIDFEKALEYLKKVSQGGGSISSAEAIDLVGALSVINECVEVLGRKMRFYGLNEASFEQYRAELLSHKEEMLQKAEMIASNLTMGKQAKALQEIEELVTYLSDIVQVYNFSEKYRPLCDKIIPLLEELTNMLNQSNMVTAADIVDFDLRDILEAL